MTTIYDSLRAARRVSTPIVSVETVDPTATLAALADRANGNGAEPPAIIQWDAAAGLRALNEPGRDAVAALLQDSAGADPTVGNPFSLLADLAPKLPAGAILAVHAAGRWLDGNTILVQAVRNLRDRFKADRRTLLLLGQDMLMPPELVGDVLGFDDPLPDADALGEIIRGVYSDASLPDPAAEDVGRASGAVRGLSAFAAEQAVALCLSTDGIDLPALWDRKCRIIDGTPGLSVYRDVETFDDLAGVAQIKRYLLGIMQGRRRPGAVVVLDEIEKTGLADGAQGDTSGVSKDQLGQVLTYMNDHAVPGLLEVGPAGTCKSAIAKAAGQAGGVPVLALDLGACKGSLVGQSEQQLRGALKVISAVSNGAPLFIGTSNSVAELPAPLRRRFTLGTFFFDLPDMTERDGIWPVHLSRFGLDLDAARPADEGWTGAEIRACCDVADRLGVSPADAGGYITPVIKADPEGVERLRASAVGRYASASYPGPYRRPVETAAPTATGRKLDLGGSSR